MLYVKERRLVRAVCLYPAGDAVREKELCPSLNNDAEISVASVLTHGCRHSSPGFMISSRLVTKLARHGGGGGTSSGLVLAGLLRVRGLQGLLLAPGDGGQHVGVHVGPQNLVLAVQHVVSLLKHKHSFKIGLLT